MTASMARVIDYGDRGRVHVVADAGALANSAAEIVKSVVNSAVEARGIASLALSGGSTPKQMGRVLSQPPFRDSVQWGSLCIFWSDERWVPLESPESNAGEAKRNWLDQLDLNDDQIHPFHFGGDPDVSSRHYEILIRGQIPGQPIPHFDLILLGMGDDGHTASLFPGTSALTITDRLVVANPVPQMDTVRLTFTALLINHARNVVFLVSGAGKADRLHDVLDGTLRPTELPSQLIRPTTGSLTWLVDEAAAANLERGAR